MLNNCYLGLSIFVPNSISYRFRITIPLSLPPSLLSFLPSFFLPSLPPFPKQLSRTLPYQVGGASGKEPIASAGDIRERCGFHAWVSKIPWKRDGSPLQYSCLENPMDRGAWQATVHKVAKSQTWLKWLSIKQTSLPGRKLDTHNPLQFTV